MIPITNYKLQTALAKKLPCIIHTANKPNEIGQFNWLGKPDLVKDTEWDCITYWAELGMSDDEHAKYRQRRWVLATNGGLDNRLRRYDQQDWQTRTVAMISSGFLEEPIW